MRKYTLLIISILALFVLSACTVIEGETKERIVSPDNNTPPILGKWVIEEVISSPYPKGQIDEEDILIGREGLFHKEGVVIGDSYTTQPSFKIKNVKATDYLLYKYKTSPSRLGIEEETVEIITVLNDNKLFYEFIKYKEDYMYINMNDKFYRMRKSVNEVSFEEIERYINVEKNVLRSFGVVEEENLQTGILIGIKVPTFDELNQVPKWEYKTLWINSQNRQIAGIYELDQLLVPRKNGFWIIDKKRETLNESVNDILIAIPKFKVSDATNFLSQSNDTMMIYEEVEIIKSLPSILKNILFVGNDYISVENIDLDRNARKTLQVYAIDNLAQKKPIKLSDLIGDGGRDAFVEGARSVVSLDPNIILNEENVGLVRKNGYWTIMGRVNYKQNNEELYKDFNIKAIPPKEMVSYDELSIPWDAIRIMVPDVVDVFTSPNNEFAVVKSSSHIIIYPMENGDITTIPLAKIKLPYDSTIIMSEWALDRYANIWQNEVINNGGLEIEY